MNFRVYDKQNQKWITDDVYMSKSGGVYVVKKTIFNNTKLELLQEGTYTYHKSIDLYDKDNVLVYEGDYILANISEDKEEIGLVCYAHELSSYIILCANSDVFYTLGSNISSAIKIIGNAIDGYKYEQKQEDKQTL